jgi:signal-transduction protein with cAMP-binding, CBS, and nucleotidyltransferase domain
MLATSQKVWKDRLARWIQKPTDSAASI